MARPKAFNHEFNNEFGAFATTAEVMIKVGDSPSPNGFKDGDIMFAFNRKRIRGVYAEHICWGRVNGVKKGGQLGIDTLLSTYLENIYTYKFERTGVDTATRTNLVTSEQDFITNDNADTKLRMDVALYVSRRLASKKKPMFGAEGAEVWYGGRIRAQHTELDDIWDEIETQTPEKEKDHLRWPGTLGEKRNYLFISVDDYDDAEAGLLVEPDIDETDPENPITLAKRKRKIDWRDIPHINEADVLDKGKTVDLRGVKRIRNSFVKEKS